MLDAKLIVIGGETDMKEVCLKLPATIGRGRESCITLPHPLVSRNHCELYSKDASLFVRDLGSLNGTFVGSERVTEKEIRSGDLLTVGTVTFRAVYGQIESEACASADTVSAGDPELDTNNGSVLPAATPVFDEDTYLADDTESLDELRRQRFDGRATSDDDTGPAQPPHKPPHHPADDDTRR